IEHEGQRLAYCVNLNLGSKFVSGQKTGNAWLDAIFPDVFDPAFAELAKQLAKEFCTPRKDDPMLLGWFSDNELHWGPDWRRQEELLVQFLKLPVGKPGRVAAIEVLQNRYGAFAKFEAVWQTGLASWAEVTAAEAVKAPFVRPGSFGQNEEVERLDTGNDARRTAFVADCDAFLTVLAEQYFSVCDAAIRTADPNHMIFGPRFAYFPEPVVIVAAMKYLDVIAFNCYHADPTMVIQKYEAFGRPLLIGEFVFRSLDSGLPNTKGAGPKVADQSARAAGMELYVKRAMARPAMVGYHWFEHADEPKEGRFDGEDSNVGLVTIKDEPYLELTERFKKVNREVDDLHEQ
ncbi:MAG: hypothetical protein FWD53_06740, partial [Phycisphaerales bacterium]|nr:hypothetical protein [Phycisphaerales bacterium]